LPLGAVFYEIPEADPMQEAGGREQGAGGKIRKPLISLFFAASAECR